MGFQAGELLYRYKANVYVLFFYYLLFLFIYLFIYFLVTCFAYRSTTPPNQLWHLLLINVRIMNTIHNLTVGMLTIEMFLFAKTPLPLCPSPLASSLRLTSHIS